MSKEPQHSILHYNNTYVPIYTSWIFRKDMLMVKFVRLLNLQQIPSNMLCELFMLTTFFHFFL